MNTKRKFKYLMAEFRKNTNEDTKHTYTNTQSGISF